MLIIQPSPQSYWNDDVEDEERDAQASSSMNLLQHHWRILRRSTTDQARENKDDDRRLTTGSVAHTQWPARTTICLDELIKPSPTVKVDLSSVFRLAEELKSTSFMFGQEWPVDLPIH